MPRADAQRNIEALLVAAQDEFAVHGVDAGVRSIATRAGVGTATLYRHFPHRADLIAAVFRRDIDACADRAATYGRRFRPGEALDRWIRYYGRFMSERRGLSAALYAQDPEAAALPAYFEQRMVPALQGLLDAAVASGAIRARVDPLDLLGGVAKLSVAPAGPYTRARAARLVDLLLDGLRIGVPVGEGT